MQERIELRSQSGALLGVLVGGTAIEIKRGARLFAVDLYSALVHGAPIIIERVLYPEGAPTTQTETEEHANPAQSKAAAT